MIQPRYAAELLTRQIWPCGVEFSSMVVQLALVRRSDGSQDTRGLGAGSASSGGTGYSQNSGAVAVHNPSTKLPVASIPQANGWHVSPLSQSPGSLHTWV